MAEERIDEHNEEETLAETASPTPKDEQMAGPSLGDTAKADTQDNTLENFIKSIQEDQRLKEEQGFQPVVGGLSLTWQSLSVRGGRTPGQAKVFAHDLGSLAVSPFTSAYEAIRGKVRSNYPESSAHQSPEDGLHDGKSQKYLLRDLNGTLKPGEMMLVLGRPGAGTTTFLKAVAGLTSGYSAVDGQVFYGNLPGRKALKNLQGQVVYNADDEVHFANIKVDRTLKFALANNTPARRARPLKEGEPEAPPAAVVDEEGKTELLNIFGLSHTNDTKVGDAYVRGVSGGERKRVSIAEAVARRASIQLWDKSTRGLDANTALDYVKVMRALADIQHKTMAISLYQAGNAIYDLFDKVMVIAEGRCIYFGPRSNAQAYFEDLGFEMLDGANIADFLTGCTSIDERKVRPGWEKRVPETAQEFADCFLKSQIHDRMMFGLREHLADAQGRKAEVEEIRSIVQREKHKRAFGRGPYGVSLFRQIQAALLRERDNRWADQFSFWQRLGSPVVMAFVTGSLFYNIPQNTGGIFLTLGVQFLTIIYPVILTMAETTAAFESRSILSKHKALSLYNPAAYVFAQSIADLPMYFIPLSLYSLVIWFLTSMKMEAGPFFIYLLFTYCSTCTMAAFFRMVGSAFPTFEDASKVSGFFFNLFASYSGYFIYIPDMRVYLGWTRWINPLFYAFEALTASQMSGQQYTCVPKQLVPYGPGYEDASSHGCAIAGARADSLAVAGDDYLDEALRFSQAHIWRNFGILLALWVFFIAMTILFIRSVPASGASGKGYVLFKRPSQRRKASFAGVQNGNDGEGHADTSGQATAQHKSAPIGQHKAEKSENLARTSTFAWQHLTYTVNTGGKDRVLLQDVQGWCKPGQLTALMGSSGAGKTTLLDCLAQRKTSGALTGEVKIDGHALPVAFQRTTGYCEQLDIHMPQSTVREALEFSALLRQPRDVTDSQKLAYVDTIVDLLELHDIEDALVGRPGAGLSVEQRKRLTIGIELAAKPRLLFADEPTSGLDGQSAFKIIRFLRKLADLGQSVLVTVHQPSASLFAEFDTLLLLKAGGKTAYFGSIQDMPNYFAERGFEFPRNVNPAEYMIEVVSGTLGSSQDWGAKWLESKQHDSVTHEVTRLVKSPEKAAEKHEQDDYSYASPTFYQMKLTLRRASVQMYRNTDYVTNKIALHVGTGLLNGFSFWMLNDSYNGLQRRLFTVFGFIFVAPGVIAQLQPKFLANRDLYETREKGAKMYTWKAFILAEIVSEVPYLILCGTIYFACWWAPVGFSFRPSVAGPVVLQVYIYELLYTGIGQAIAAYAPNATFAALVNPVVISVLVLFNGAFVPYSQMQVFWKYWLYWLNPFNYLMGGLLVFPLWDQEVKCSAQELGRFSPPAGQTCGSYMSSFLSRASGYLVNPDSTENCEYCIYSRGSDYLADLNLGRKVYGWRDICITLLFALSSYGLVFIMMKLRTKQTKAAKGKS